MSRAQLSDGAEPSRAGRRKPADAAQLYGTTRTGLLGLLTLPVQLSWTGLSV
jgi:hypothetical protein